MMDFENDDNLAVLIKMALDEDIKGCDVTSEAVFNGTEMSNAFIVCKEDGVYCGSKMISLVYHNLDDSIVIEHHIADGTVVKKGDVVASISGSTKSILIGERTVLNFIQRMSGIATKTHRIVELVNGTDIKILDTRKTLPGFRMLDKYSVKTGGGTNHRIGLYDMVMIKDNHIKAAGSISKAVEKVRLKWKDKFKIEVETTDLNEVQEAVDSQADIIMLDNMDKETMRKAIEIISGKALIEISGNMDAVRISQIKDLKIDYISIGGLTHSIEAFDLSMKFR